MPLRIYIPYQEHDAQARPCRWRPSCKIQSVRRIGGNDSDRNPSFGGNVNEPFQEGDAHGLFEPRLRETNARQAVHIFAGGNLVAPTLPECCNTALSSA